MLSAISVDPTESLRVLDAARTLALDRMPGDVSLSDIERAVGVVWTEVRNAEMQIVDPLFAARLRARVEQLFGALLRVVAQRVDLFLATLAPRLATDGFDLDCMSSQMCGALRGPLMQFGAPDGHFKTVARDVCARAALPYVRAAKELLNGSIADVRALLRCSACLPHRSTTTAKQPW